MTDTTERTREILPVPAFEREGQAEEARAARRDTGPMAGFRRTLHEATRWGEVRRTPYGLRPMLVLLAVGLFGGIDDAVLGAAFPEIIQDLDLDIRTFVGITALIGFFGTWTSLGIAWIADRRRRVPIIGVALALAGLLNFVAAFARSAWTFALPRAVSRASGDASLVPRTSLLADYYPPESRGKVFSIVLTLRPLTVLATPIAVGYALTRWGWRPVLVATALPVSLLGFLFLTLREPRRGYMERRALGASEEVARIEEEPRSFGEAFRAIFAVRTVRRLFIAGIFGSGVVDVFGLFFVLLLAVRFQLDPAERALVLIPVVIASMAGAFVGGGLVDRLTRVNPGRVLALIAAVQLVSVGALLLVATEPGLAPVITLFSFTSLGFALIGPARAVIGVQVLPPAVRTQGSQISDLSNLGSLIIWLPLSAPIFESWGYSGVFIYIAILLAVNAVIVGSASGLFELDMRSAMASSVADEEWRRAKRAGETKLLVCRDVDVSYDSVQVLFGVDFDVEEGELVALLGTNGAGKSTLLKAISGTQEASGGAIVFDGRDITHMPPNEVARRGVIHMPGGRGIFPGLTVRENLVLARWNEEAESDRLADVLDLFPILRDRADTLAGILSGGEQQMLSLAQAFITKPRLLMIDELALGLAPSLVEQLAEVVREINRRGVTVIIVEQSVSLSLTLAQRAVFMEKGEVKFFGNTADLLRRTDLLRAVFVRGTGGIPSRPLPSSAAATTRRRGRTRDGGQPPPVLEAVGLSKRYGGIAAIDDVSLAVGEGQTLGLIGPNGAGKTTLFDLLSGYQTPDRGRVNLAGADITATRPDERAALGLVRRFQDARLFPSLSVHENLLVALDQQHASRGSLSSLVQRPAARAAERRLRARSDSLVELLGLGAYRDKLVRELSTGVRRIVDLACVLAAEPKVVLLDEPSSGIAQAETEGIGPLLRRVRHESGCAMLVIEHSMSLIAAVADRLVALDQGRVIAEGTPAEVLDDEKVVRSYLGLVEPATKR